MAITIQYAPDARLVGNAAYQAGLGQYLREQQQQDLEEARLAEQQYQFDQQIDLRRQTLDAELEQDAFQRNMAGQQLRLQKYGLMSRAAEADAARQAALADDAMRYDYGLAQEQLQQEGQNFRQGQAANYQHSLLWQQQAARQMQADWANILKAFPKLDPDERDELRAQFEQKWQHAGVPMPVDIPDAAIPDWADPEAKLREMQSKYPNAPWQVDQETGEVGLPRGWNYQMDPEFQKQQFEQAVAMEKIKSEGKTAADQQKMRYDAAQQQVELESKQQLASVKAQSDAIQARIDLQVKIATARASLAALKAKVSPDGTPINVDTSAAEAEIAEMENMLQRIAVPGAYQPPSAQMGQAFNQMLGAPPVGASATIIGPNAAGRYARKHPDGSVELLPEGFAPQ